MKKLIVITFVLSLLASSAFAADVTNADVTGGPVTSTSDPVETITTLSNNVGIAIVSTATAFSANTAHLNGSKQYGTSSETTKIYSQPFEHGVTELIVPTDSTSGEYATVWAPL